jgi:hypothetical protein
VPGQQTQRRLVFIAKLSLPKEIAIKSRSPSVKWVIVHGGLGEIKIGLRVNAARQNRLISFKRINYSNSFHPRI